MADTDKLRYRIIKNKKSNISYLLEDNGYNVFIKALSRLAVNPKELWPINEESKLLFSTHNSHSLHSDVFVDMLMTGNLVDPSSLDLEELANKSSTGIINDEDNIFIKYEILKKQFDTLKIRFSQYVYSVSSNAESVKKDCEIVEKQIKNNDILD